MSESNGPVQDLESLASMVEPLPLDLASAVLDLPLSEVASMADALAEEGRLVVERVGLSGATSRVAAGRFTMLATRLAEELERRGAPARQRGLALWHAGDADRAFATLESALSESIAADERPRVVDLTVEAGRDARVSPDRLAPILVERARQRRNRGESDAALRDLDDAISHLEGERLVDALAFAGAIEDDLQHPADAERQVSMAMMVAAEHGYADKLGSLYTFLGRVLSRLGFDREADDSFARGSELVASGGTEQQRFYAALNRAWTDLDRGWMQRADNGFTVAREKAEEIEGRVSAADKDIAIARSRFGTGDAAGALAALERARGEAESSGAAALWFLIAVAETEGALAFHRVDDALAHSQRLIEITSESFPAWTNRAASLRARALLLAGDRTAASEVVETGLAATPHGANGLRLRTELEAIGLAADSHWDGGRAADVADRLLQAGWLGMAAWLLTERSRREESADVGRMAAALAHRLGNPMMAAEAIEAAGVWSSTEAGPVALAIGRVGRQIPEAWVSEWRTLPFVERALASIPTESDVSDADLLAGLDAALAAIGLAGGDTALSPSQRRAAGLVAAPSRAASVVRWLAPLVGAAVVAAVVGVMLAPDAVEPQIVEVPGPTVTVPTTLPGIEEIKLDPPAELSVQGPFAGGDARNAVYDVTLGDEVAGFYWRRSLTGFVRSDVVARGRNLYVGTSEGFVSNLDIVNEGAPVFEDDIGDPIEASFTTDLVSFEQGGQSRTFVLYGDASGRLHMRNIDDARGEAWVVDLGSPVTGPPLVRNDYVVVATESGLLLKLQGDSGEEIGRFPSEGVVEGGFEQEIAGADGVIYAVTGDGRVELVDEETMSEICQVEFGGGAQAVTHPVVADGRWFVGSSTTAMFSFGAGSCSSGGGIPAYQIDVPIQFPPVVIDGTMWNVADAVLMPISLADGQAPFVVSVDASVTAPMVVAGDQLLVAVTRSDVNELIAISRENGSTAWSFRLDGPVRTRPLVGNGVVIVATDQAITAIAVPAG